MKKKHLVWILFISISIIIVAFIILKNNNDYPVNIIELSPTFCNGLFGVSPEEFCQTNGKDTIISNGYTYAEISENGNLILHLNDSEIYTWKNSRNDLKILQKALGINKNIGIDTTSPIDNFYKIFYEDADENCGFDVSDDYTKIIATPDDNDFYYLFIPSACFMMQIFEGKPSDKVTVDYIELDSDGKTIEHIVFTEDTFINSLN